MARNKLTDLNDHLFMALERLNEEDLDLERLDIELKRVRGISSIAKEIIHSSNLIYKVAKSVNQGDINLNSLPSQLNNQKSLEK